MLVYVDDILITGSSPTLVQQIISNLNGHFSLKQLGELDYFLGIETKRLPDGSLLLTQTKYIRDLLAKTKMTDCKPISSPMVAELKLSKDHGTPVADSSLYRSVVGALQYLTITRPELSFAINKVCQFMSNPLDLHWTTVKHFLRYLKGTMYLGLKLNRVSQPLHLPILAYCDADWATDINDRRYTSGACVFLGSNLISWWSRKQPVISRSTTEAEYRSLAQATSEILWIQTLFTELKVATTVPTVLCDNLSTVALAHNPVLHSRTKHMELDLFFVREKVLQKQLLIQHIPATQQLADALTKPLSSSSFLDYRSKLNVCAFHPP